MVFSNDIRSITDRDLDFEYRKYVLLAYLQKVGSRFREKRLYPYLNELKRQYTEFLAFKGKKDELANAFPGELSGIDLEKRRLTYEASVEDEAFMEEIDRIIELSLPRIKERLKDGEELRSSVMDRVDVRPVGLLPLQKREGYLLLSRPDEWRAYRYRLNMVQDPSADRRYRDLRTRYLSSFRKIDPPEKLKEHLIKEYRDLPDPAVFRIGSELLVPHIETLLPIAKQLLMHLLGELGPDDPRMQEGS